MIADNHPSTSPERSWFWWTFQMVFQMAAVFAFRYRVRGLERLPPGGALLLINHQSFIDPLAAAVGFQRPVCYLARHDLFRVPFVGWVLRNTFVIPIQRNSAASESIRLAVDRIQQGHLVGIFPEGTRSIDGKLQEIKPGFLAIIRRTRVPVIPIGIAGTRRAFPRGSLFPRSRNVRVVIGEPLSVAEAQALSQRGREAEFISLIRERLEIAMAAAGDWLERGTPAVDSSTSTPTN